MQQQQQQQGKRKKGAVEQTAAEQQEKAAKASAKKARAECLAQLGDEWDSMGHAAVLTSAPGAPRSLALPQRGTPRGRGRPTGRPATASAA